MRTLTTLALLCAVAVSTATAQPRPKQLKDQAEHDLYNQALKDTADPAKAIPVLDTWTQRYPNSDYQDERLYLYLQAYSRMNPPDSAKVVKLGSQLLSKDLGGGLVLLNVLFIVAFHVAAMPAPSPADLALGEKAARDLLAFAPKYFVPANKPDNKTDTEWTAAHADIEARTAAALAALAIVPGNLAMAATPPDCPAAEAAYRKALADYPNEAGVAYHLGRALSCQGQYPKAIYYFIRAAALDPTLDGGTGYAASLYRRFHGSDDGLPELQLAAKNSPTPPDAFTIESAAEVETRKQADFAARNPQYAFWKDIREQLATPLGAQYFEGQLKNAAVRGRDGAPALKGAVSEGRPTCRPKELLITIPPAIRPEILIRLDSPIPGQIVPGEIEFDAIPRAFTPDPLLLTVDVVRTKIANLKIGPCAK